jgi:class 3 adenylate cyclase
MDVVV